MSDLLQKFVRVSRNRRCPICGKADWCLVARDGSAAICPRVESDRPTKCGYYHRLGPGYRSVRVVGTRSDVSGAKGVRNRNWVEVVDRLQGAATTRTVARLCGVLGGVVTPDAVKSLGIGFHHVLQAWSWPMFNGAGRPIGVMLRFYDGRKRCLKGSKLGLYIPGDRGLTLSNRPESLLLVAEGATDTAAALSLGYHAIGRPSCQVGDSYVVYYVRRMQRRGVLRPDVKIVVIADGDGPGINGAVGLFDKLIRCRFDARLALLPDKDIRAWLLHGATAGDFAALIRSVLQSGFGHRLRPRCFAQKDGGKNRPRRGDAGPCDRCTRWADGRGTQPRLQLKSGLRQACDPVATRGAFCMPSVSVTEPYQGNCVVKPTVSAM